MSIVPLVLGLAALWGFDASQGVTRLEVAKVDSPAPTRLVVFLVDSLARRDVETRGAMPKLRGRMRASGLRGPVRECADAITVPCMLAAITGVDHLSVFALGRNFAGASGAIEGSVLGALEAHGHRVGYFGERMLAAPLQGVAHLDARGKKDPEIVRNALAALDAKKLDVALVHLRAVDEVAHAHTAVSKEYARALKKTDALVDQAIGRLRETDHYVVMGDHGHADSGRHAAGLDANTYAAFFGPRFVRKLERPMAMTDHGALWARVFGLRVGAETPWIDAYFAGRKIKKTRELPMLDTGAPLPWWLAVCAALVALVIAFEPSALIANVRAAHPGRVFAALAALGSSAALGAAWLSFRAAIWTSRPLLVAASAVVTVLTGVIGGWLVSRLEPRGLENVPAWERRYTLAYAGAMVFAMPTVYWYGGAHVVEIWFTAGLLGVAIVALRTRDRRRAVLVGALVVLAASLYPAKLANYVLRGFPFYTKLFGGGSVIVVGAAFVGALVAARLLGRRDFVRMACTVVGFGLAALAGRVPDFVFLVPIVAALPLTLLARRHEKLVPAVCLVVPPAMWFAGNQRATDLVAPSIVLLLWATVPALFARANVLLRGLVFLSLVWLSFWTTMGCRITGIDFDFTFKVLPLGEDVTSLWLVQTLLALAKYVLPAALGTLLARDALSGPVVERAFDLARGRVGMALVCLAVLRAMHPDAGTFIVGDVLQEVAFFLLMLAVLRLLGWFIGGDTSVTARAPSADDVATAREPDALVRAS